MVRSVRMMQLSCTNFGISSRLKGAVGVMRRVQKHISCPFLMRIFTQNKYALSAAIVYHQRSPIALHCIPGFAKRKQQSLCVGLHISAFPAANFNISFYHTMLFSALLSEWYNAWKIVYPVFNQFVRFILLCCRWVCCLVKVAFKVLVSF